MRYSEANNYIKKLSKRSIVNCIRKMYYKDGTILDFNNPITIMCGLNGVGKTRIIETIFSMFGYIEGDVNILDCQEIEIGNKRLKRERIIERKDSFNVIYFNAKEAERTRDYLNQNNIDELKDGVEPNKLTKKDIHELNCLVGRNYTECIIYEFNDEFEGQIRFPYYFEVVVDSQLKYTSLDMGMGEHIIIMFYYLIWKLSRYRSNVLNNLFLIDELESYISVGSQYSLMNLIAKTSCDYYVQFIISTHSPFVIKHLPIEFIRLIKLEGKKPEFRNPGIESKFILDHLGLEETYKPYVEFLVEDELAKIYLNIILNYIKFDYSYKIIVRNGFGNIENELKNINCCCNSIKLGILDGDMRNRKGFIANKRILFLPGETDFESSLLNYLHNKDNLKEFSQVLQLKRDIIELVIEKYPQTDKHDLIKEMKEKLNVDIESLIQSSITLKVVDIREFVGDLFLRLNELIVQ